MDIFQALGFTDEGEAGAEFFGIHEQDFLMLAGQSGGQ